MEINTPPKPVFLVRMVWCWLRLGPQNLPVGTAEAAGGFLCTTSRLPTPAPFPRAAGTTPVARRLQIRTDVAARSRGKMIIKDSQSRTEPQPTYGLATVQHPALDLRPADTIRRQPV